MQNPLQFNPLHHPYSSRRWTVYANGGMVATSHPLAAQAGLSMLLSGGNAVDAAIAAAATLTVAEPTSNGLGGDAFALVWSDGKLFGLNASGPAPMLNSIERFTAAGLTEIPAFGWSPVTVPGIPSAWAALALRFSNLPMKTLLAPAIQHASEGHPVAPIVAKYWDMAFRRYQRELALPLHQAWFDTFAPQGRAPYPGEAWKAPHHAATLTSIAETNAESFYRGAIAEQIDAFSRATGGTLRLDDLAAFRPTWVEPISTNYRGYDVWELPPNGQGIVALMALNMLEGFDFGESDRDTSQTFHRQLESIKLAFADAKRVVTDPSFMNIRVDELLAKKYAEEQRRRISDVAVMPTPGKPYQGGTVYLATADKHGNMVSYIQSNYMGFGSGLVVPGTGIALQNRGHTFSLDPSHVNALEGGKRTYHTIIPGFLTKGSEAIGPFGVMGGFMQPQGHVQVVMNTIDFGMNPQAALDAPRWQWTEGMKVSLEQSVDDQIANELRNMGHDITVESDVGSFGRGQIIWRLPSGTLAGGTEPRADGHIAAW